MIKLDLCHMRVRNRETGETLWATYNAVFFAKEWYVEKLDNKDDVTKNLPLVVKYNGICHALYLLDQNKYAIETVNKIGTVQLTERRVEGES